MNGPVYIFVRPNGEMLVLGEQDFPGAAAVAARTIHFIDDADEAERIRQALLHGEPVSVL